ncbi:AMP-binding protein [Amycolatopsis sp. NPDC059657]|uniref:AMP-binding protein n=1 Tax=Amycolatopsis sp. NPDC059657 TaxID=3346899 RepID=UPI00366E75F9
MNLLHELVNVGILARGGIARPMRPDKALRIGVAALRWGMSPATLVAAAAIQHGERAALIDERGTLSFVDLDRRSSALAAALSAHDIRAGSRVAVMCRNHRGFVDALAALGKLGADALLLNTAFAGPQLADVLDRERADAVIYDHEFEALIGSVDLPRFVAWHDERVPEPTLDELIQDNFDGYVPMPSRAGQVVILTSGTTGAPKGVARKADSLDPVAGLIERIPLRRKSSYVVAAPMFHTWGLAFLLLGLQLGATQIVRRKFDPETTLADLASHRASVLVPVPVMLRRILDLPRVVLRGYDLSGLEVVAAAGSALPGDLALEWMTQFGHTLYNIYGSTEVALVSIATPADLRVAPDTAGRPARGTIVKILDENGLEVSQGVTGRIFVASGALFEGYTSGETKQSLSGLMSTGDVGYLDAEGRLYLQGRDDDMIVSGGENVFPQEVEDLLDRHPAVKEAAAIGVPDEKFGQRLRAFVVLAENSPLTESDLRQYVKENLAGYKVPREILFRSELPRNATGKIVKRLLQAP